MEYKINKLPKNEVEIEITLNEKEWQDQVEGAYQRNKGKYNIEGFRKGKAPRKVIEKLYGPTIFYEDAVSEAFYVSYMEIMNKEKDFEPVDTPTLDVKEVSDKKVVIVSRVAVKPEVKLAKYTKFGVKPHDHKVTDEDVEHELKHAQEQNARLEEVEREVKVGDIANINYSGSVDGVVFDGGTAENYDLEIGSHTFIEGFEEQVVGLKAGEEKDINVTFPKEYHAENLKGKPAVFKVKVNSVKEKVLPELDDAFASDISEFETLAEYKADIKKHLEHHMEEHIRIELENEILDNVVENMEVEIPGSMVENELDNMFKEIEYRLMYQGLTLADYASYMQTTVEALREERRAQAEKNVKIRLALQEIIRLEKIDFTEKEVDAKIEEMAKSANKSTKEYKNSLSNDHLNYIKNDILMSKLMNFLVENN